MLLSNLFKIDFDLTSSSVKIYTQKWYKWRLKTKLQKLAKKQLKDNKYMFDTEPLI